MATEHNMVLFFDEIQSFAKKSSGGAQLDFGVTPDICTIGKSLGAGLPLSAILGTADLMDRYKPVGDVAHSGTFNAPLTSILAGLAFVNEIKQPEFWQTVESLGARLFAGLDEIAARSPIPVRFQHHGSRFGIIFGTREPVTNYKQSLCHKPETMVEFCRQTTARGRLLSRLRRRLVSPRLLDGAHAGRHRSRSAGDGRIAAGDGLNATGASDCFDFARAK